MQAEKICGQEGACKQCPLNENYRFRTKCTIRSCKNYSSFTETRCLGLDVKFASDDKTITDVELLHYKFDDREVSLKDVSNVRKKAVERVKNVLALYRLVSYIADKEDFTEGTNYQYGVSPNIDDLLRSKPLRIKLLGFQPWMLKFIFDEKYVKEVVGPKFKIQQVLGLKTKEYSSIVSSVKGMSSGKTLFESII